MRDVRPRPGATAIGLLLLAVVVLVLFASVLAPPGHPAGTTRSAGTLTTPPLRPTSRSGDPDDSTGAQSIATYGSLPTEAVAGSPALLSWVALDASGARVSDFAPSCEAEVVAASNGTNVPAWVNASASGPTTRSSNGTFAVPSGAWSRGVLNLSVTVAAAIPVTVRLAGPSLPAATAAVGLLILPDRNHLVLYDPTYRNSSATNATLWLVHDRFGDPAPGAMLTVTFSTDSSVNRSFVPVTWTGSGVTGAWVNYSALRTENATLEVSDAAGAILFGPTEVPATETETGNSTAIASAPSLSSIDLAAVALVGVGGIVGMVLLLLGGRARSARAPAEPDDELRRLAEGRATVVELLERKGPLTVRELELAWEPPPAPPAVADWVASLVADGTVTAGVGGGGEARFAVTARPPGPPRVTLDEEALERGIARRDAAVEDEGTEEGSSRGGR